jgi:hypothetical protein
MIGSEKFLLPSLINHVLISALKQSPFIILKFENQESIAVSYQPTIEPGAFDTVNIS